MSFLVQNHSNSLPNNRHLRRLSKECVKRDSNTPNLIWLRAKYGLKEGQGGEINATMEI